MDFDPKWLDILKATGPQTGAIALACGLFLLSPHLGWIAPLDTWVIQLVVFLLLITGWLSLASLATALYKFIPLHKWIIHWRNMHGKRQAVRRYIPHMTPKECEIIGYLLYHNQKMFTGAFDGGYARTLISHGIVVQALRAGQAFSQLDVPYAIPDYVWNILVQHKDEFPYQKPRGKQETHPWREPMW
jgi:hypothetical protein